MNGDNSNTDLITLDLEERRRRLGEKLKRGKSETDFQWSIFVAAANSYRFSSVLTPFPPNFYDDNASDKNIFALRDCISKVKPFSDRDALDNLSEETLRLLSWILLKDRFQLKLCEKETCFKQIKDLTGQVMEVPPPSYILEVQPSSLLAEKFEEKRAGRKLLYAYHGSRLDNFYSILHNGLNSNLNKVAVFGEGTYLSSELSVSLMYSKAGQGWNGSILGAKLSCVAVCEMIDDSSVKCQVKGEGASRSRAQASSTTDAVPEKYYVVQNDDMIRVRYLLVYREEGISKSSHDQQVSSSWWRNNKMPLLMLAYVLILVAIGLSNSRQTVNSFKRFYKQFFSS